MNESLGRDARALIDQASAGDEPSLADRERMRARLALALAATAATSGGFAVAGTTKAASTSLVPAATAVATAVATKVALAVALVGALGGAAVILAQHPSPRLPTSAPVTAVPPRIVDPAPMSSTSSTSPRSAGAAQSSAAPIVIAPAAPATVAAAPASVALAAAAPDVAEELVLLRDARSALKSGDSERSLHLLAEHARRFPHGALTEEREAARAVASCAAVASGGSPDTARAAAARFLRSYPRSLQASHVQAACAVPDPPSTPVP